MLVCINKGASENDDDDDENEDEIQVTRVCRFTASIIFYFNTAKSTYNIQKYQALPHTPPFCQMTSPSFTSNNKYCDKLTNIYT